ncbi:MAG TPA: hypothetical protein VHM31_25005, partial [Polyangia bacterium]|nr:hypothetical protein [Polyangia bacterium]
MAGARSGGGRRWPAALLGALLMLASSACQRGLEGARCPCASGWTCCAATNRCVPESEAPMCTTGVGGQAGGGAADGAGSGGSTNRGGAGGQAGAGGVGGAGGAGG